MLRKGLQAPMGHLPGAHPVPAGLGDPLCSLCHRPGATTAAPHPFSSPSLSPPGSGVHSSLSWRQMASTESSKQQSHLSAWHVFPCLFSAALSHGLGCDKAQLWHSWRVTRPLHSGLWITAVAIFIIYCTKSSLIDAFLFWHAAKPLQAFHKSVWNQGKPGGKKDI